MSVLVPNRKGLSLLDILVCLAIFGVGVMIISAGRATPIAISKYTEEYKTAQSLGIELIEYIRSHTSNELLSSLKQDSVSSKYPLCTYINILDRKHGITVNPDPLAQLGSAPSGLSEANRAYRVRIVDGVTLSENQVACFRNPSQITFGANEKLLVSVIVTWKSGNSKTGRVALSTLLP